MKIQHLIPVLFLAAFCTVSAQTIITNTQPRTDHPVADNATNRIAFTHAPVSDVLAFYGRISGLKLVVDSHVKTCGYWMTTESSPAENKVLMKLIEKTLEMQAGIVITKLDDNKRASVTINDDLIQDSWEGFGGVQIDYTLGPGFIFQAGDTNIIIKVIDTNHVRSSP